MGFLGLLALSDVEKDAVEDASDDALVVALATRGNPANLFIHADAEVDLVSAGNTASRGESRPHPIPICRVDVRGEILETDVGGDGDAPQIVGAFVHGQAVSVDVPRP